MVPSAFYGSPRITVRVAYVLFSSTESGLTATEDRFSEDNWQPFAILALQNFSEEASLPCVNLPVARNARFYDRDNIVERIDAHFDDRPGDKMLRSLALFGPGGVGKSHVAQNYAHVRTHVFPAVLWVQSETAASLQQSFSDIAIRLTLSGAEPRKFEENRILVLDWLQKTS